jgi:hypothetical protein
MDGLNNCPSNEKECITKEARRLWEKEGRKQGRDLDYWLIAERAVKGSAKKSYPNR